MSNTSVEHTPVAPIWHFMYRNRHRSDEVAYREHFMDADIRQVRGLILAVISLFVLLNVIDYSRSADQPAILTGIALRTGIIIFSIGLIWAMQTYKRPWILDLTSVSFATVIALGITLFHYSSDSSIIRIISFVFSFIYIAHIAFPNYALLMLLPVALLMLGESYTIFFTGRLNLEDQQSVIVVVALFAECVGILSSAYHHRTRYQSYHALTQVKLLSGLLPICATCKKIRDDHGYYQQIESYITQHADVHFTHGICPECATDLYAEIDEMKSRTYHH